MPIYVPRRWRALTVSPTTLVRTRSFRSDRALQALNRASEDKIPNLVLYKYPTFSGAFSALLAHLFHSRLSIPCLILPFSSFEPFRVEDLCIEGLKKCYLLDFVGPKGFAVDILGRTSCELVGFDHRKSALSRIPSDEKYYGKLKFFVDGKKSSSTAAYEYFSTKFSELNCNCNNADATSLLNYKERERLEMVLKYIQDGDLHRWCLPHIREFKIGLTEWRSKFNCITNPYMYDQLLEICSEKLIAKGSVHISSLEIATKKLLNKAFKVRLGRGFYGECLGVRADGNSNLSDEIGKELSKRSAEAGLRPIGAVIYLQQKNLKMSLRSTDCSTDTSEVAKAYGGGGSPRSSSFIIRMDEYNQWLRIHDEHLSCDADRKGEGRKRPWQKQR